MKKTKFLLISVLVLVIITILSLYFIPITKNINLQKSGIVMFERDGTLGTCEVDITGKFKNYLFNTFQADKFEGSIRFGNLHGGKIEHISIAFSKADEITYIYASGTDASFEKTRYAIQTTKKLENIIFMMEYLYHGADEQVIIDTGNRYMVFASNHASSLEEVLNCGSEWQFTTFSEFDELNQ